MAILDFFLPKLGNYEDKRKLIQVFQKRLSRVERDKLR